MVRSVFITGCNRGIGLELVKQFLMQDHPPEHVFATCRDPSSAVNLTALKEKYKENRQNLHIIQLDVTDWEKHAEVVAQVESIVGANQGLNLLINNAGILPSMKTLDDMTPDIMLQTYATNCVAPIFLTRAFLPLLKIAAINAPSDKKMTIEGASVIEMSTAVASIAENGRGGNYPYRCSKTALNMGMKNLSIDLEKDGILVMAMHPGWVQTDMGGPDALITTEECVTEMMNTLRELRADKHGSFLRYNNTSIQW